MMRRLKRSWVIARSWLLHRHIPFNILYVLELPEALDAGRLYVVGENGHQWFAAILCPCGCGATLQLNLQPDARPRWMLKVHWDDTPSLHPSVWRVKDCRSHFFLRRGLVEWCRD